MAGATNRQFKTAGIPRAAVDKIRVKAGGRLTLKGALGVAAQHGIPVPEKAHAFAAARDEKARKVALRQASARRGENVMRSVADVGRVALANRRAQANAAKVEKPVNWNKTPTGYVLSNGGARIEKEGKKWVLTTKDGTRYDMPKKPTLDHADRIMTQHARDSAQREVDRVKGEIKKATAALDASRRATQGNAVGPDKFKSGDMKPGDRLHVGAANISKVVSKHTRRNSNGMGRYSVSSTTYIVRVGKKQVESVGDFRAAIAAAKTHGGDGPTRLVKLADRDDV